VTDRQTERQSDIAISISRVSMLTNDKNHVYIANGQRLKRDSYAVYLAITLERTCRTGKT